MAREKLIYKECYKKPYLQSSAAHLKNLTTECSDVRIIERGIIEIGGVEYIFNTLRVLNRRLDQ